PCAQRGAALPPAAPDKELARRRPEPLPQAAPPRPFGDRPQHDVHAPDAPRPEREQPAHDEEYLERGLDDGDGLDAVDHVEEAERLLIVGPEAVAAREAPPHPRDRRLRLGPRPRVLKQT